MATDRLKSLYRWDADKRMTCQSSVPAEYDVKVAQGMGIPGWLCLTRDHSSSPVAYWVQRNGNVQILRIVMDDRCFEDTIFRVEYTSTHVFIADVWLWNGIPLFQKTNFAWRQSFLQSILPLVYTSCPEFESRAIELRNHINNVRGYEYYSKTCGSLGKFAQATTYEIHATDIPDVYRLTVGGYLRVRTFALSRTLASMGKVFHLECIKNPEDDTWSPVIESCGSTNGS
jgi:hypothetical protein